MDDFFVLVWLLSWVGIIFGGVSWLKTKRNAKTKLALKQCKILLISISNYFSC